VAALLLAISAGPGRACFVARDSCLTAPHRMPSSPAARSARPATDSYPITWRAGAAGRARSLGGWPPIPRTSFPIGCRRLVDVERVEDDHRTPGL